MEIIQSTVKDKSAVRQIAVMVATIKADMAGTKLR